MTVSSRVPVGYAAGGLTLAAAGLIFPALIGAVHVLIVVGAVGAILAGVRRHRPRHRSPWYLLAAALVAFAAGTLVAVAAGVFPSAADIVLLIGFVSLIYAALIGLARCGMRLDRSGAIDGLILVTGAGFLAWTFLINPFLHNDRLGLVDKAVAIAYPLTDLLLFTLLVRLFLVTERNISLICLLVCGGAMLTADSMYVVARLGDWYEPAGPIDAGWLLMYVAGGTAALHPSMVRLTEPRVHRVVAPTVRRGVLMVASLLAPAALLVQALGGPVRDGVLIAMVAAGLILLSLARVAAVAGTLRHALDRERELRLASEALTTSTSAEQVSDVLRDAVGRLLPPGTDHLVVLAARAATDPPDARGRLDLLYTTLLPGELATDMSRFELALHFRLAITGDMVGEVTVGAPEPALLALQESLPVLGQQAATMIDRIRLNREVGRAALEQELLARAYVDPLTGFGSRLKFSDDVAALADGLPLRLPDDVGAVLVVDIDEFRAINDTMGAECGDQLLVALAFRMSAAVGTEGTLCRLGADEFGVVLPRIATVEAAERLAERVLHCADDPFAVTGSQVGVRLRAGLATTLDAQQAAQFTGQADVALEAARDVSGPRWRRYEATMHARVIDRMALRGELSRAVADGAFALHYQPIVSLSDGRTVGFEALIRWPHPTRGMVGPDVFIPLAEESGLIVELGAWVMRTAITEAVSWARLSPQTTPYVSVNVSVRQFHAPGLVSQIFDELSAAGLPPGRLTVEITESLLLGEQGQVGEDIARLRAAGIKVSIDDFGTGYSSLSYLHRISVDTLKLDKSFVDTIVTSQRQHDLVRGIVQMAAPLSLAVVAEGVETGEQHEVLLAAGCAFGQGFHFARPLPVEEARNRIIAETLAPLT